MWRTVGALARGSSHEKDGTPCQDAFSHLDLNGDTVLMLVADGAGSAKMGQRGAEEAIAAIDAFCRVPPSFLESGDDADIQMFLEAAIDRARSELRRLSDESDTPLREFATTLQLLILAQGYCAYGRIGDGGCVGRCAQELVAIAPRPCNDYVNETVFLTADDVRPEIVIDRRSFTAAAVFTDGLQNIAMKLADWEPHPKFFAPVFAFLDRQDDRQRAQGALQDLISSPDVNERTDDDRTLLVSVTENGRDQG